MKRGLFFLLNLMNQEYIRRINLARAYIEKHLEEQIDLETVAQAACFSKYHFHRIFTAWTGETPAEYIQRLRMELSANMLKSSLDVSVAEIAERCGISSLALFSRMFKARFLQTPTAYRKNSKISKTLSNNSKNPDPQIEYFSDISNREKDLTMNTNLVDLPSLHLAAVTSHGGYNESISNAYKQLIGWMRRNQLLTKPPVLCGIALDNPDITALDQCRYKACAVIPETITASDEVEVIDTKAGLHAVLYFNDTEEAIVAAYSYLYYHYLPEQNLQPADAPHYSYYLESPANSPERLFAMEIRVPVERMGR